MYRTSAQRIKRSATWALSAATAVAFGVAAANFVPHSTHAAASAPTSAVAPSSATSASLSNVSGTASVQTVASTSHIAVSADTVLAFTGSSITVRSATGATLHYGLNASTIVLQGHAKVTAAALRVGERVFIVPSSTNAAIAGTIGILPAGGESEGSGSETAD